MSQTAIIFTQIVQRPNRKLMLFRASAKASDYWTYATEVGCEPGGDTLPWATLASIKQATGEPVGLWLPPALVRPGTGLYAHGVELPADWAGPISEGFDVIDLPAQTYLVFQGEPYDEETFGEAIDALWERIGQFNPVVYGYEWDDDAAPRMQLEPQGWRGYIEMRPIRSIA